MRILKKIVIYSLLSIVFIFLAILFYSGQILSKRYFEEKAEIQQKTKDLLPKVLEDLEKIRSAQLFPKIYFNKNAEPLVSQNVGWVADNLIDKAVAQPIFKRHLDWMKSESEYQKLISDPEFIALKVDWVEGLKEFDFLSPSSNELVSDALKKVLHSGPLERVRLSSLSPLLNYSELCDLVTAYAIKNRNVELLHHVAQLLATSETTVASMVAVVALRREVLLAKKFNIQINPKLDDDLIERVKRAAYAWPGLIQNLADTEHFAAIQPFMIPELFVCAATAELPFSILFRQMLKPKWPFESDFTKEIATHQNIYGNLFQNCHRNAYQVYIQPDNSTTASAIDSLAAKIPYLRRNIAFSIMSVAMPNFLGGYMKAEEPTSN